MKHVYKIIVVLFLAINFANAQESFIKYKVAKGETIPQLAKKFNVFSDDILKLNPDTSTGVVENQMIFIPNKFVKSNEVHLVEAKETLFSIARNFNVSVEDLVNLNQVALKDGLRIGQTISIPSKKKTLNGNARVINSETIFHVVASKETKYSIAKKYGISVEQLETQNPEIVSGLQEGSKLAINTNQVKSNTDKEALMIALAEKQAAVEKAKLVAIENAKLKGEQQKSADEVKIANQKLENLRDSLTVQKDINQKVLNVNGLQLKLSDLDYTDGTSVERLRLVLEANKNIESVLVTKLRNLVSEMRQDVEDLKTKEISDPETTHQLEIQSEKNLQKTTEQLQNLKKDLAENRKTFTEIMNDVQRVSVDANNEYKKKSRENAKKPAAILAMEQVKRAKLDQVKTDKLNKTLISKAEGINAERDKVVKSKIKMATFYSEESRTFDDKMALERLKRYKKDAEAVQVENKFKNTVDRDANTKTANKKNPFKTIDIEIIKNLNEVKNSYYLVTGVFKEASKRDEFLKNMIDAGELKATFFFNVNTFTYYVYTNMYPSVNESLKGFKLRENQKYFDKMKIVKVDFVE